MENRIILHIDANCFFASVECISKPHLRTVPMAVAGDCSQRHGIILAKNELARSYGIKTAETVYSARRKCPTLTVVPPSRDEYTKYSRLLNAVYLEYTDLVEPFGIDESWLDITHSLHLFTDDISYAGATHLADSIRDRIKKEHGLTVSVGVSFNKVLAKLGSDYKKPDATTTITPDNFRQLVYPLPPSALLYVGQSAERVLSELRIATIGQLARYDRGVLIRKLGKLGGTIWDYANGIDDDPVASYFAKTDISSVSSGNTFAHDIASRGEVERELMLLCDEVTSRLRGASLSCYTVCVGVKYPDLKVVQRQTTLSQPTHACRTVFDEARSLIARYGLCSRPIRALTVTLSSLTASSAGMQLSLFDDGQSRKKLDKLDEALDGLKKKYGKDAVKSATTIDKESSCR